MNWSPKKYRNGFNPSLEVETLYKTMHKLLCTYDIKDQMKQPRILRVIHNGEFKELNFPFQFQTTITDLYLAAKGTYKHGSTLYKFYDDYCIDSKAVNAILESIGFKGITQFIFLF